MTFFVGRVCVTFVTHSLTGVAWFFFFFTHSLRLHDLCFWRLHEFFAEKLHNFFVERLHDFLCGQLAWFFWVDRLRYLFVDRLRDFGCGKVAWFLCVERLHDFSHSLNQVAWFILSGGYMIFFGEVAWFFVERLCDFFVWRGCVIFCVWKGCVIFGVKRWHDFLCEWVF